MKAPPWKDVRVANRQRHRGHFRTGSQAIQIVTNYAGILFPHAAQITRRSRKLKGRKWNGETVYIITTLPVETTSAAELNSLVQAHSTIETRLHWVRDVVCLEDKSIMRCGNARRLMVSLRNLIIGLYRIAKITDIAQATRHTTRDASQTLYLARIDTGTHDFAFAMVSTP